MTDFHTLHQQLEALGLSVPTDTPGPTPKPTSGLARQLRQALLAKMDDVLQNPIWCPIPGTEVATQHVDTTPDEALDDLFGILDEVAPDAAETGLRVDADGRCEAPLAFDLDDAWRGREKELLDDLKGSMEESVWLLTPSQAQLLQTSPRDLIDLHPSPYTGTLAEVITRHHGGRIVPVAVVVEDLPPCLAGASHFALVPNLTPLQRMKAGLDTLLREDCPEVLVPLQALLGLATAPEPLTVGPVEAPLQPNEKLDAYQRACVHAVQTTPHFALVKGPPGSGKTTVIRAIIEREVRAGKRVLVVSPTHVAVDNVTEKLWPAPAQQGDDRLAPHTLPVRWASRDGKLSPHARQAWQSKQRDVRAANIALRLESQLSSHPQVGRFWTNLDEARSGTAPLSPALAQQRAVICGTPIGILSAPDFMDAAPGAFDLLIVDEVSKLTLPEFLAIAVYAKRWALIGDPDQLPPYLDAREASVCLTDIYGAVGELAASVTALIEARPPRAKNDLRLVVATTSPERTVATIRHQMHAADVRVALPVHLLSELPTHLRHQSGIVVCAPDDVDAACREMAPHDRRSHWNRSGRGFPPGTVAILAQHNVAVERPHVDSGCRLVEARERAPARLMALCHDLLHTMPWAARARVRPPSLGRRKGLPKLLPHPTDDTSETTRDLDLARAYALLGVSVYDWLDGVPDARWPRGPLARLADAMAPAEPLRLAVAPWTSTLCTQYRMVPELSAVPRRLFYDGAALLDGRTDRARGGVRLVHVPSDCRGEDNSDEAERIFHDLDKLHAAALKRGRQVGILMITPYRKQERLLREWLDDWRASRHDGLVSVDVCTLDRCQGREAEMVMVSLVRSRASSFLDNPKRWNVALTRARDHLLIYGNIHSYLRDVREPHSQNGPKQSVVTTLLRAYDAVASRRRT